MSLTKYAMTLLLKLLLMYGLNIFVSTQEVHHTEVETFKTIPMEIRPNQQDERWTTTSSVNSIPECENVVYLNAQLSMCISKDPHCVLNSPTYDFSNFKSETMIIVTNYNLEDSASTSIDVKLTIYLTDVNNKSSSQTFDVKSKEAQIDIEKNLKSVRFELVARKFCGEFKDIKIQYSECDAKRRDGVEFPKISNPIKGSKTVNGTCIENAVYKNPVKKPFLTCMSNGTYVVYYGDGCECDRGYQRDGNNCIACKPGYFKSKPGDENCKKCGDNSRPKSGSECICVEGFVQLSNNGTAYCSPVTTTTPLSVVTVESKAKAPSTVVPKDKFNWVIIAGSVVGGLILVIIILVIVIVYKRQFPDQFEVSRMEDGTMKTERRKLFSTSRIYVDPTTYSQVDDAVQQFTLEIDRKYVTTDHLLGGGEFANVFKGIMSTQSRNTDVAIKILKPSATKMDRDDFLSEAAILGQFSDPNVITIEGVVLKDQPNMIVLEYMENGSLDKYLVKNDSQLSIQKLLVMTRGVASGMKYLADLGYIHRDLAARNILVNTEGVCKIADFGMSRELKTDDTYDTKGGKIPIKWTAPEAIEYKKFTTASDVWSYGILMWEIFSFGERPYWEWNNLEVIERLSTGYRLPPPMECPKVIHDLMLQCWHKDRMKRPRFTVIFDKLEDWLKTPELLAEIASVITRRDEDLDYSVMEDLASWLEAIKMEQYLKMFTESGYMAPKDVLYLTNEDLESLGVGILGHRKKLLKAIRNTRLQIEDGRRTRSSSGSTTNSRVSRSTSFGSTLTKKVSFYASPHSSISFKRSIGKRPSLQGYKLT